ncbi:MAG: hypothetical protein IJI35_01355 [Kiritimatiellae bacterium]|nr:hypothetical protein [Kiritimatiellia bacterium]
MPKGALMSGFEKPPRGRRLCPRRRLANVRDGEEDYEYLVMAEAAVGREKVADMVRKLVSSPTKFTRKRGTVPKV